jgi:hypothetical protein
MFYDWYCIIVIFCPNIIAFLQCKIKLFLKALQNPHKNHYNQRTYRYVLHLRINEILPKRKKKFMNELIYF